MSHRICRRRFLHSSLAAGAAAVAAPAIVPSWARGQAPSDKLALAVVGVGGRGAANLGGVSHEKIVALCDADDKTLAGAARNHPAAQTFADFRVMLDKVGKQIDAVVVSTPDHTHAPAAAMALRMGKHCYCEKPLTRTVFEARTLTDLARANKRITQIGTQIHAEPNYRRVVELVRSGAIGTVGEVHVWSSAAYGGQERPKDTPPCPPNLHWDLWLGPSPERPYHPAYVPGRWRNWWDFGTGSIGDFGCHYMDLPFWALSLSHPASVDAEGPKVHPESTAKWLIVKYEFPALPATGELPARGPVKLTWYDGGKRPLDLLGQDGLVGGKTAASDKAPPKWSSGVLFVGSKGMLLSDYGRHLLLPEKQFEGFQPPPKTIPDSIGHHREWTEACKGRGKTTCPFEYSGPLTETALLGCVSFRSGAKLAWDAAALKATNAPQADWLIRSEYRKGWVL